MQKETQNKISDLDKQIAIHQSAISSLTEEKNNLFPKPTEQELRDLRSEFENLYRGEKISVYIRSFDINIVVHARWQSDDKADFRVIGFDLTDKQKKQFGKLGRTIKSISDSIQSSDARLFIDYSRFEEAVYKSKEYKKYQKRISDLIKKSDKIKDRCGVNFDWENDIEKVVFLSKKGEY